MLTREQLKDCTRVDEHIKRIEMSFNNATELLEKLNDPCFKLLVNRRPNKRTYPFVLAKRSSGYFCEILINEVEYCKTVHKLGESTVSELYKFR